MWKYLTNDKYNEFLLSLNLVNTSDIKKVNKILYNITNNIDNNYEEKIILKKSGKKRFLTEPSSILKNIQRRILKNVLEERRLSSAITSYRKGYSLIDNAKIHINKKYILKLDIKNFFDNITFKKVYDVCFNEDFYPKKMGFLLANLCCYDNKLPQGAPTSGYISNLVLRNFDIEINNYCLINNISYSRYADDLTFSGDFDINYLINLVRTLLKEEGFILNAKKTKILNNSRRQLVTGIVVNKKLNISKKYKKKIRQDIYYIKKYGLDSHLIYTNNTNNELYIKKLLGKICFVLSVEKKNKEFINYKNYILNNFVS